MKDIARKMLNFKLENKYCCSFDCFGLTLCIAGEVG